MTLAPVPMALFGGTVDSMIDQIFFGDPAAGSTRFLSMDIFSGDLGNTVNTIYHVILPFALMVLVVYFFVNIIDKTMAFGEDNVAQWVRNGLILVACMVLMNNGYEIVKALFMIGQEMYKAISGPFVSGSTPGISSTIDELHVSICGGNGFGDNLKGIILLFIPYLLTYLFPIIIQAICCMRVLEIATRAIMMPLALSDFFQHGLQGSGWRNLKAFFAAAAQTGVIYLIVSLNPIVMHAVMDSGSGASLGAMSFLVAYLAIWGATIGLLFKSQGLIKDIVGV